MKLLKAGSHCGYQRDRGKQPREAKWYSKSGEEVVSLSRLKGRADLSTSRIGWEMFDIEGCGSVWGVEIDIMQQTFQSRSV